MTDSSGARIPRAHVSISDRGNDGPGRQRDLVTDAFGSLSLELPPGAYTISVAAPEFQPSSRSLALAANSAYHLSFKLTIQPRTDEVSVPADASNLTSADDNQSALVFAGNELNTFSNADSTFQQQIIALAGGTGPVPPNLYVDGFSNARFPPKSAIRQVRINRNQYSAQFDSFGNSRVEIFTKPGTDALHGSLMVNGTDAPFNAVNPYTGVQPPYYLLNLDGNLNGPINSRTSFFLGGTYSNQQNNAAVVAVNTDGSPLTQAVPDPQTTANYTLRLDRQLTSLNALTGRYEFNQLTLRNGGVGQLNLAAQAFNSGTTTQTLQLSDSQIVGMHLIADTRAQYIRRRQQQDAVSSAATVLVQGSFSGGGNPLQSLHDTQDNLELQEYISFDHKSHYLRFGGRYRLFRDSNYADANFNGQFIYDSLSAYNAGMPSQYSVTRGNASAAVSTSDLGLYVEDEWKLRPDITLDLGLRLETQTAVPDHFDPAPRVAGSWAVHRRNSKSNLFVLRGGAGIFYDRFPASALLTSVRQNGLLQQSYILANPSGCTPSNQSGCSLGAVASSVYQVNPRLRSEYGIYSGLSVERYFGRIGSASINYSSLRGVHQWDSRNANAPLPGTGVRPLGGTQNVYQFDSGGIQKGEFLAVRGRIAPISRLSLFVSGVASRNNADANGPTAFASNSFNLAQDFGPQTGSRAFQLYTGGSLQLPYGLSLDLFASAQSGANFNITTGTDLNGDSLFNDRPAFATAPTASSVLYNTRFGSFDANPQPDERIIPINYGRSPSFADIELSASRSFKLGPRPVTSAAAAAPVAGKPPAPRPDRPFNLNLSLQVSNALNHPNPGLPVGVLGSPLFGRPNSLSNVFSTNTAANRVIILQTTFSF